jgi:predicted metalloendopeptidase
MSGMAGRRVLSGACLLLSAWLAAAPRQGSPVSGLDLDSFDRTIRPQDDLYRFVNGGWVDRTTVPPDRVSYGTFPELADRAEHQLRTLIEDVAARPDRKPGSTLQQIADLYASILDEATLEALGDGPLRPELARIDAIRTTRDLAAEAGALTAIAAGGPFAGTVTTDTQDPSRLIVLVTQGGTLLPDRDYYLKDDAKYVEVRRQYVAYLERLFTLAGRPRAADEARDVLALEIALAGAQLSQTESRNPGRTFNPFTLHQLAEAMPGFDWIAWARPQGIDRVAALSLTQPSFFRAFAELVPATPLATWRAWLAARYLTASAPYVSQAFNDVRFDFFGRVLTGQELPRVRWKRGVSLVSGFLGDAIGRLYVERHFPPAARERVETIAAHMIASYRDTLKGSTWLSPRARSSALAKLSALRVKVGYPDKWRSYAGLRIRPDDLLGNVQRAQKFQADDRLARLQESADPREWLVTAQTVNAYYNPSRNEIVLPAGVLQPPLFIVGADDAINYGAIGGLLGHELTHAFDNTGRAFDATGQSRNWWTREDEEGFAARARQLVDQFDAAEPMAGQRINGLLTLAENVGDLAGLAIACDAYRRSLGGTPSTVLDGFTGEQRVFLGWARTWRSLMREDYLRQWLLSTPYAPPEYRTNIPAGNLPAFYDAFGVKEGDKLFRQPGERISIW